MPFVELDLIEMDQLIIQNTMTYYSLTVVQINAAKFVPLSEIEALPFADFWKSMVDT